MKDLNINHKFTLREILEDIMNAGANESGYKEGYDAMKDKLNFYLDLID